ncbi:MAG: ATP-binding protein [Crocinitomicaceae bacterium]|nr:ATP-binding protein [Crocinitomicaceae bacterium]
MVGRNYEINRLQNSLKSADSELIAVYGRRRVGKTFLIRNIYQDYIKFEVSGLYEGTKEKQLEVFFDELKKASLRFSDTPCPSTWKEAFDLLKTYINGLRGKEKKVIFIDEMPWLDTHKSDFRMYFGHFWNTYCEKRNDLIVVVCGSAASYMVQNVISNKGSLHARLTYKLHIKPFTLFETKAYLESKNIQWGHYHILHLYIAIGGIPHYLNKIVKGESVVQAIQRLCFDSNGDLVNEFDEIFESLFSHSSSHIEIIRTLGKINKGLTREEIIADSKQHGGGSFTRALEELIASGFVSKYVALDKKLKSTLYRLSDEYSRFYLKYIEPNKNQGANFWKTLFQTQSYISWAGFNFETICLKHISQIKKALKIEGIHSVSSSWTAKGAQVDLVVKRDDHWINLFEMKFYNSEYTIEKSELDKLRNKIALFKNETGTKDTVALTFLTTFGVTQNAHFYEIVENSFTMEVLFEPQ